MGVDFLQNHTARQGMSQALNPDIRALSANPLPSVTLPFFSCQFQEPLCGHPHLPSSQIQITSRKAHFHIQVLKKESIVIPPFHWEYDKGNPLRKCLE